MRFTALAFCAALAGAPGAWAGGTCAGDGDPAAQATLSSRTFFDGLARAAAQVSMAQALKPHVQPRVLALHDPKPCRRMDFTAAGETWRLMGGDGGPVPRYATPDRLSASVVYLFATPSVEDGVLAMLSGRPAPPKYKPRRREFSLVVDDGDQARVFLVYDATPTDGRLSRDMAAALEGTIAPLYAFNARNRRMKVFARPADLPTPPGVGDASQLKVLSRPDGAVFLASDNDEAVHAATGFACPERFGAFRRTRLMDFQPRTGGEDVGCHYEDGQSFMTVYVTRVAPGPEPKEIYLSYAMEAEVAARPSQVAEPPMAAGAAPAPEFAQFWLDGLDQEQGVWVRRYGDWYVKVRATMPPETAPAMTAAARQVFARAGRIAAAR